MDRKQIIKALEEHAGVKAKYMGVPSFAYQILIEGRFYIIDRLGKITLDDVEVQLDALINGTNEEKEVVVQELSQVQAREQAQEQAPEQAQGQAQKQAQEKVQELAQKRAQDNEALDFEITIPLNGHTGATLRNMLNMLYSKQPVIKKAFEIEADILQADFIADLNKASIQTIDEFKNEIAEKQQSGFNGIEFDFTNNTITFKFFRHLQEPDRLEAYTHFASLLSQSARSLKHASPKPTTTDNFKFTMRVWLIRLGFVGNQYKRARKLLLQNLEGNSAYRKLERLSENNEVMIINAEPNDIK
ncbi:virulence-related protein [Ruminiclostridium herbifermentans]|uniref:Virulence-related protein n=1 Tax=Ruminiclostridium herbifermentans TaxID=2488810 RepID=A0A7H1VMD4_9FIRM|nr:virulence-related protein [Ruminiclostridium herbifermentans]QNU66546.1 virulence-related protein [Ruminiclostridium herbifermentans]